MLQHVLERFLRHTIEAGSHLDGDRFRHVSRDISNGKRRALCELVGMILNCRFEAQMFQAGGVESIGEVVNVIRKPFGCFSKTPTVRQQVRLRLTQSFERAGIDRQTRRRCVTSSCRSRAMRCRSSSCAVSSFEVSFSSFV